MIHYTIWLAALSQDYQGNPTWFLFYHLVIVFCFFVLYLLFFIWGRMHIAPQHTCIAHLRNRGIWPHNLTSPMDIGCIPWCANKYSATSGRTFCRRTKITPQVIWFPIWLWTLRWPRNNLHWSSFNLHYSIQRLQKNEQNSFVLRRARTKFLGTTNVDFFCCSAVDFPFFDPKGRNNSGHPPRSGHHYSLAAQGCNSRTIIGPMRLSGNDVWPPQHVDYALQRLLSLFDSRTIIEYANVQLGGVGTQYPIPYTSCGTKDVPRLLIVLRKYSIFNCT